MMPVKTIVIKITLIRSLDVTVHIRSINNTQNKNKSVQQ